MPKVVDKSEAIQQKIKDRLIQSIMFKTLGEAELKIVIDAMEECKVQQDQ